MYWPRELKLPFLRPLLPEARQHASVHVEHLHAVVVGVGYQHAVGVGHGDVVRVLELPELGAERTELAHERAVGLEHL